MNNGSPTQIQSLEVDETVPAGMFDPELTYFEDGTNVVMRARGEEKRGVAVGKAVGAGGPYAFQAVRFEDGTTTNVAPHVLHRDETPDPARLSWAHNKGLYPKTVREWKLRQAEDGTFSYSIDQLPNGKWSLLVQRIGIMSRDAATVVNNAEYTSLPGAKAAAKRFALTHTQ